MSLTAAMIDAMVASGCTPEQIAAVVKADMAERELRLASKRAGDAQRQRRHRMSRNVTVTERDENSIPPLTPPDPQTPPPISPPNPDGFGAPPAGDAGCDDEKLKPEHFAEAWNDLADRIGKPRIRTLTPERRIRLRARIAGYSLDEFREVLGNIERSAFLRGDRNWQGCTFDWVTKKANFQKILEGNYNG